MSSLFPAPRKKPEVHVSSPPEKSQGKLPSPLWKEEVGEVTRGSFYAVLGAGGFIVSLPRRARGKVRTYSRRKRRHACVRGMGRMAERW